METTIYLADVVGAILPNNTKIVSFDIF